MFNRQIYVDNELAFNFSKLQNLLERHGIEYSEELALDKGRRIQMNPHSFDYPEIHRLDDGRVVIKNTTGLDDWMCWNSKRKLPEKSSSLEEILLFSIEEKKLKLFLPKSYQITRPSGTCRPEYKVPSNIREEVRYLPDGTSYTNYSWKSITITYYADTHPNVIVYKIPEKSFRDFFIRENKYISKIYPNSLNTPEKLLEHHLRLYPYGCGEFTKCMNDTVGYPIFYELV